MSVYINNSNKSYTEKGALQYSSTEQDCLDLFSRIGSMRNTSHIKVLEMFKSAYDQNPKLATQILFWARSARIGAGERAVFRTILKELHSSSPAFIIDNAINIAELGYWKDLLHYFDLEEIVDIYAEAILAKDRLACKWAPRKGPNAIKLRNACKFTNKQYRVWLRENSVTVEQQMTNKQWSDINYSSVPGQAMRTYKGAFNNRDKTRFDLWKADDSKASVSASYPHNVTQLLLNGESYDTILDADVALAEKQWKNLPDYISPGENILPIIDVSGSMCGLPMLVAISLGLYVSERCKSTFKNRYLTFSSNPQWGIVDEEDDLDVKFKKILKADWGMSTDFERAYRLILDSALQFNVPQEAMPTMLLCLSDMQFDSARSGRLHLEEMQAEFKLAGYDMPKLVFWNLDSRDTSGSPATKDSTDVGLVSGFSPALMKAVLACEDFNPLDIMYEALKPIKVDYTNLPTQFRHNGHALKHFADGFHEGRWEDDMPIQLEDWQEKLEALQHT